MGSGKTNLQLVTARLRNPVTQREIVINVAIDSMSTGCMMTKFAAEELDLHGEIDSFVLQGIGDVESKMDCQTVVAEIISMERDFTYPLKRVRVIPVITEGVSANDWRPLLSQYGIQGHEPVREGRIDLLIGMDHPKFLQQHDSIEVKEDLILFKNSLGWSCCGIADREEILEGQTLKIKYSNTLLVNDDVSDGEDDGEEESDRSSVMEILSLVAQSRRVAAVDVKRLIDLVQNSTQYDNFEETGMTVEEERCLKILQDTYKVEDGRAYISPLWRENQPSGFKTNYKYALGRLNSILRGMTDENFECLDKIFEDYLAQGIADEITDEVKDPYEEHAIWWAHFPVVNPNSETTPVRPVMDGKAACINGKSINDHCYHKGPCMINDLVQVLLRYRKHDVAFVGDISKMFLKVYVPPEMRRYARFIWVQKDRKTLRYFQFRGHVFGNVGSPTCAIFVTQKNAEDHKEQMPRAAEAVIKSTLVDDTLDSVTTNEEAVRVIENLIQMSKDIGLKMSKIATTSTEVSKALSPEIVKSDNMIMFEKFKHQEIEYGGREYAPGTVAKDPTMRTLGQYHNMPKDTFGFISYEPKKDMEWTKTRCLSQTAKVFDPLGYAVAILLEPKLIIQELWKRGTEWTDVLTPEELKRWNTWLPNLPRMEELSFDRVIMPGLVEDFDTVQVHVFSDASEKAFASVAFIRITYKDSREVYTNFIQAKCNISPIKKKRTVPKLELMGIHQGARLADKICNILDVPKNDVTIWSDSKTALQWLRMESTTLVPLVHNYCGKIKALFPVNQIRWVSGRENVADIATRPKSVSELLRLSQWKTGPTFLRNSSEYWPTLPELRKTSEVMEGVKKSYRLFSSDVTLRAETRAMAKKREEMNTWMWTWIDRFHSYGKMLRVFSYVVKFVRILRSRAIENKRRRKLGLPKPEKPVMLKIGYKKVVEYVLEKKKKKVKGKKKVEENIIRKFVRVPTYFPNGTIAVRPSPREIEEAEMRLVRQHQLKYFSKEIAEIKAGRNLLGSNKLSRLGAVLIPEKSCFNGDFDILRLSGRVALAPHLCEKMRRPFVLHPDDEMVKRMIKYYHADVLKHMGGVKCLICEINRSRWIVGSISHLKKILNECYECRRWRPRPMVQKMAPLPATRIPGGQGGRLSAFTFTALDVAGPWLTSHGRGKSQTKRWLLIFRCATVGAVHLEMLYSMDTSSFLMALIRFTSHASTPEKIYCDKGTNLVRGDKEMELVWEEVFEKGMTENQLGIEFVYSPPESPHFNGLIERMIGEAKRNLVKVLPPGELQISDEALLTSFKQVQKMLNNRPIEVMNSDVDPLDLEPLTPAHFLQNGKIFEDLVPPNHRLEGCNTLAGRFWTLQSLMDKFWTRLCHSLAPALRKYSKWITKRRDVQEGDLICMLEDKPEANGHYRVGLVTATTAGQDGMTRRVTVRMRDGKIYDRGLNSIYVLVPKERLYPSQNVQGPPKPRRSERLKQKNRTRTTTLYNLKQVWEVGKSHKGTECYVTQHQRRQ